MPDLVIKILNKSGLHARLAAELVKVTIQFESHIEIVKDDERVDGKSIMEILTLAATYQSELKIIATGIDENEALQAISEIMLEKI